MRKEAGYSSVTGPGESRSASRRRRDHNCNPPPNQTSRVKSFLPRHDKNNTPPEWIRTSRFYWGSLLQNKIYFVIHFPYRSSQSGTNQHGQRSTHTATKHGTHRVNNPCQLPSGPGSATSHHFSERIYRPLPPWTAVITTSKEAVQGSPDPEKRAHRCCIIQH